MFRLLTSLVEKQENYNEAYAILYQRNDKLFFLKKIVTVSNFKTIVQYSMYSMWLFLIIITIICPNSMTNYFHRMHISYVYFQKV